MAALDIHLVMAELAKRRPIFHSEKDFQFALAWQIHAMTPDCKVRLERPFTVGGETMYLDIWLSDADTAIELKYGRRQFGVKHDGETFALRDGATDLSRYEFVKDIQRIEKMVEKCGRSVPGYAVLLANNHLYWTPGDAGNNDEDFYLHEGRNLTGTMYWSKNSKDKDKKNPLALTGSYELRWKDYSALPGQYGRFRYLAVEVS